MIETFSIWMEKDDRQRVLFPHYVEYSEKYFENLLVRADRLQKRENEIE